MRKKYNIKLLDIERYLGKEILCIKSKGDIYTKGKYYRIVNIGDYGYRETLIIMSNDIDYYTQFTLDKFNIYFILNTKEEVRKEKINKILD